MHPLDRPRPEVPCPSCGAPLRPSSPATLMMVCEYCRTASYWNQDAVQNAGQRSHLPEGFTRLYRGASGYLHQSRFTVLGRARYRHRSGLWDEWFISHDQGTSWITEDDHELALQDVRDGVALPPETLAPGDRFAFDGVDLEVDEVGDAECVGIEGELPRFVLDGQRYRYLDASSLDGRFTLGVERSDPPKIYVGRWLGHEEVRLDDEIEAAPMAQMQGLGPAGYGQ